MKQNRKLINPVLVFEGCWFNGSGFYHPFSELLTFEACVIHFALNHSKYKAKVLWALFTVRCLHGVVGGKQRCKLHKLQ